MVAALQLRAFENHDDDLLPRLISWLIAGAIGASWLIIVHVTPAALPVVTSLPVIPPVIDYRDQPTQRSAAVPMAGGSTSGTHPTSEHHGSKLAIAEIFAGGQVQHAVAEIARLIPGVTPVTGEVGAHAPGGKTSVSARGDNATPGISRLGDIGQHATSVGDVKSGGAIDRAPVHVQPLPIVTAPMLGSPLADATEIGSFVRIRVAQLQSCYERNGGSDLAGVVALRLTVGDGGSVRTAEIVRRSWSGPGAAATEQCLLDLVRGWRMPSASAGATVTIPISFTRGA